MLLEYFYENDTMARLMISTSEGDFEIESIYNNDLNKIQFEIYNNDKKKFTIESLVVYGQGKEISWRIAEEDADKNIDVSLIEHIGSSIESFIN